MSYLAIDPGLVTGVATYFPEVDSKPQLEEVPGGIKGAAEWLAPILVHNHLASFDFVFIEDWNVRPNTHKLTPQPDPYLIIGFVQGLCHVRGTPLVKLGPGEHKGFNGKGKKSKVRRIGWVEQTTKDDHAEDAASVMLSGLLRVEPGLVEPLLKEIL